MKQIVLAVDYCNLLFGSYYGEKLINSHDENVNAVKGFFFKLKMLKDMFDPDKIVFANDLSRSRTFRRKLYKPYKAQRKEHDPDIMKQMEYASRLAALIGYPFLNHELYEADDILGMISKFNTERDVYTIIVSSDRDLYQLINDYTFIFSPKSKELIDKAYIFNKYQMTPEQWVELKILQGDRSDNIPGIPGIGEVTALKLMQQFGSIDGIYSHMGYHKPKIRDMLQKGESIIPLTRELVTIVTDYTKIDLTEDKMNMLERFENEVYLLLEQLELYSLFNVMNYSLFINKQKEDVDDAQINETKSNTSSTEYGGCYH